MSRSFQIPFSNQSLDQNTIRILYARNKMFVFPSIVVIAAIFLLFFAVVPQIQNYFSLKKEMRNIDERIAVLKSNVTVLSGINTIDLDSKLQTVISALPPEKDFAGILQVIGQAASNSDVKLGDFSFAVGDLSSEATKITNALPIEITVTITSSLIGTKRFLEELTRRFPLSEVTTLHISDTSSSLKIIFYYKKLPQISFDDSQKLKPISKDEATLFETLASFAKTSAQN